LRSSVLLLGYLDEEDACDLAERLSIEMLPLFQRARGDLLYAPYKYSHWAPEKISELLGWMSIREAKIDLVSSSLSAQVPSDHAAKEADRHQVSFSDAVSSTQFGRID
jgi:hypothetical protein